MNEKIDEKNESFLDKWSSGLLTEADTRLANIVRFNSSNLFRKFKQQQQQQQQLLQQPTTTTSTTPKGRTTDIERQVFQRTCNESILLDQKN
jgi:hypothetical protein